jgi:subtilisin family serine protease
LSAMAGALQNVPGVQYVDPVHRVTIAVTPNDPLFPQQWALTDAMSGINVQTAWGITTGTGTVTVAVADTGITVHPDLDVLRILPGYNFISDPASARNNDGRDANPSDMGDWAEAGACFPGSPASNSSWHGTFVTGLIGADSNNGVGITGVNWAAQILPVRVLGMCGGTSEDVFAGVMWAAGVPIDGVPANPNPARVINLSLGGDGPCDGATQEAVDTALAQGAVIVAAAGNNSEDAANFAPANCSGVITVAAGGITGNLASYSNFGATIELTAPGGDFDDGNSGLITSTWNDGLTVPGNPTYGIGAGTSFAAPHVTGTVALMMARNANLTSGQVQSILQGTARTFPPGTICASSGLCGAGVLDAGAAVGSTVPSNGEVPPGAVAVIEYYRADLDHYFITSSPTEITYYDTVMAGVFQRTGEVFFAYPSQAAAPIGAQPVCRYSAGGLINSNFWSANATECATVGRDIADGWTLNTPSAFWIAPADGNGACAQGNVPVYSFFNNRRDANQRFTLDLSVRRAMINRSWVLDGPTPNGAVWCSPIST